MASILDLESQLAFGHAEGLMFWFNAHAQQHSNYVTKLTQTYKVVPPSTPLRDQGAMRDWIEAMQQGEQGHMTNQLQEWLLAHEKLHLVELTAIGDVSPIDISTVDFRVADEFYDWMYNHIQMHDTQDGLLL
jgi:hypothetical protein